MSSQVLVQADWYKDAVIYEVRLRSFYDHNGDGLGDLVGLIDKLDYIRDLGVDTVWILPFYPSPLVDDGYDIADYRGVHPDLGTLKDFKRFLSEAHARGLRVVTELVLNHTSDQHAWFERARRSPKGSVHRNFYVWSDDPTRYSSARIIFQDFESSNWTWDPVANAYFWHRFYSNQPDLNFDNPRVVREVLDVVDFWLGMGIDGLRLDAVPYLFERDGTNCENLPETHEFLRTLRSHMDKKFPGRMLLAEANQWPEDAVAYFGNGDECHMCFHFPIMPRLFMGLRMEDSFPILDILEQTPAIPESCQWAVFLRNHDELTLEMVTDEERDYMVSAYAADRRARVNLGIRRRLAPLMENHRGRIELMNALLFSLPGTPVLYYGDEIGMGDNIYLGDRNGVRTPMQWNGDRNAGFSKANPQRLVLPPVTDPEYHYSAINVEAQQENPSSLLFWTKRIIGLRRRHKAFGRGSFEPLFPDNRKVLAFLRRTNDETVLVVANLSRFAQHVELDLSEFRDLVPMELFGGTTFPPIGSGPYALTLSPHGFYWLLVSQGNEDQQPLSQGAELRLPKGLETALLSGDAGLVRALFSFLPKTRWYRDKSRELSKLKIEDAIALTERVWLAVLRAEFTGGEPSTYLIPLALFAPEDSRASIVATVAGKIADAPGSAVVDASARPETAAALLLAVRSGRTLRGKDATLHGVADKALRKLGASEGRLLGAEQSNSSYRYGTDAVLKLFRMVEAGQSVELEVLEHLEKVGTFQTMPRLLGHLEIETKSGARGTAGIVQTFVENRGDAFGYFSDAAHHALEHAVHRGTPSANLSLNFTASRRCPEIPPMVEELIGGLLPQARLLGRRTAELHQALAAGTDAEFRPEPWGALSKRAFYQSLRNLAAKVKDALKAARKQSKEEADSFLERWSENERALSARLLQFRDADMTGMRMRVHGDYHLGQVLHTGKDFVILDFEGEPARTLSFRRGRRSPLADVAGMIRSFDYAALAPVLRDTPIDFHDPEQDIRLAWAEVFSSWLSGTFLESYRDGLEGSPLLPTDDTFGQVLGTHVLEKALYELVYELNNRPSYVPIPLRAVLTILKAD